MIASNKMITLETGLLMRLLLFFVQNTHGQEMPPDIAQCPLDIAVDDESGHTIHWPAVPFPDTVRTVYDVPSSPLCLDGERFRLARNCTPLGWQPAASPSCAYTQQSYADAEKCPLGYRSIGPDLCVLLTSDQPWNNTCLQAGTTRTLLTLSAPKRAAVLSFLHERRIERIWMPAARHQTADFRFGPVVWQLPGREFGEAVEFDEHLAMEFDASSGDGVEQAGCLSLNVTNGGRSAAIEDCSRLLPVLCVFEEDSALLQLACPPGFVTTRYQGMQSQCFGMRRVNDPDSVESGLRQSAPSGQYNWVESECRGELFSLDTPEKTALYRRFARSADLDSAARCLVGVLPNVLVESRAQWQNLSASVEFVNWAEPGSGEWTPERPTNVITADRAGLWHWSADFECFACQRSMPALRDPHIELRFQRGRLFAVVYNREFFWRERRDDAGFRCFTDADAELLRAVRLEGVVWSGRVEDDRLPTDALVRDKTRTVYELRLSGDGPGLYWCDGFAVPDFRRVRSERLLAHREQEHHRDGVVFAVLMRTSCRECRYYLQNQHIKDVAQRFKAQLQQLRRATKREQKAAGELLSIDNVRVMRLHAIDMQRNYADLLFHVTVDFDSESAEEGDDSEEEDQLHLDQEMFRIYRMRHHLQRMLQPTAANRSAEFRFQSLNSTEFCLPATISATTDLNWMTARIGEMAAPKELCLLPNGLPRRRQCVGDFTYGGAWHNVTDLAAAGNQSESCNKHKLSPITRSLYEIDRAFNAQAATSAVIQNVTQLIESTDHARLIPADLFYLGRVMQTIIKFNQQLNNGSAMNETPQPSIVDDVQPQPPNNAQKQKTLLRRAESENIFAIYNRLMFLNERTTRLSAALNSTNVLLEALDNVVNHMSSDNLITVFIRSQVNLTESKPDGTIAMHSAKLLVYVIDPLVSNVSGIALVRRADRPRPMNFLDYGVRLLYTHQSAAELLHDEAVEVAAFVPQALLRRLDETRTMAVVKSDQMTNQTVDSLPIFVEPPPPVSIVITIYYNDLLFQEFKQTTFAKPGGKIVSVSIPGYGPILPDLLPLFIRSETNQPEASAASAAGDRGMCGYWNFQSDTWSNEGCEYGGSSNIDINGSNDTLIMCACSHLTHFAYLIMGTYFHSMHGDDDALLVMDTHQDALDLITLLGCSLSLAGICGICVTALVFPAWRQKANAKVLLHLSAAIGLQMVLLCFVNTEVRSMDLFVNQQWRGCVTMGALLHYSVLVAFTWMLITAYLQFIRYVCVLGHQRSTRFFLKSSLIGWGVPLVPVGIVVAVAPNSYIPDIEDVGQGICYPNGMSLYFGVVAPMALIVVANFVIFVVVIWNILRGPDGRLRTANERALTLDQLRVSILLFFLLGLTWIFGFLASTHAGLVFSYLFCLTATLQGFVLFVYFIVLDPATRQLWCRWLKRWLGCGAVAQGADGVK